MANAPHPELPFIAYQGEEPFLFVCYAHEDARAVYGELRWLREVGANVWYDEGISPGHVWPRELAGRIDRCRLVLFFVTRHSLASSNCLREVHFAIEHDKPLVAIFLDDSKLPPDWEFAIGHRQAILRNRLTEEMYRAKLRAALDEYLPASTPHAKPAATPGNTGSDEGAPVASRARWPRSRLWFAAALVVAIASAGMLGSSWWTERTWLEQEAMPQLHEHVNKDAYGQAYLLAAEIERRAGAGTVAEEIWQEVSAKVDIASVPAGAEVSYRLYDDADGKWRSLGKSPLSGIRVPRDWLVLRFEKEGYETALRATPAPGMFMYDAVYVQAMKDGYPTYTEDDSAVVLLPAAATPEGMIHVPASGLPLNYPGFQLFDGVQTPAFDIDRLETTNAQYQAFVDAGGYSDPGYWSDLEFRDGDQVLSLDAALARFTDTTGRRAPARWELGRFLPGTANQPVTGISWYEAMAYARFRERSLPSVHHWLRAAISLVECCEPIAPKMARHGNFSGRLVDVGTTNALGPFGTLDMGGNASEWVQNGVGELRVALGGGADELSYYFYYNDPVSPWDRNGFKGLRTVKLTAPLSDALRADVPLASEPVEAPPMSDDAFAAVVATYAHAPVKPDARIEEERESPYGPLRRVSLRSGVGDERFDVYIVLPPDQRPPYQGVVVMGGANGFVTRGQIDSEFAWTLDDAFRPILRSGRAIVWPVWYGSFTRYDGLPFDGARQDPRWLERSRRWRREADVVVEYLRASGEFEADLAFCGLSFGAIYPLAVLHLVPQIKTAVLLAGGSHLATPESAAFAHRLELPILMLKGRYDYLVPTSSAQRLFDVLATPAEHKRLVLYDSGHWPLPRSQTASEIDAWLDRYLGEVN